MIKSINITTCFTGNEDTLIFVVIKRIINNYCCLYDAAVDSSHVLVQRVVIRICQAVRDK